MLVSKPCLDMSDPVLQISRFEPDLNRMAAIDKLQQAIQQYTRLVSLTLSIVLSLGLVRGPD